MKSGKSLVGFTAALALAAATITAPSALAASQRSAARVTIGATDIGGIVTGPKGPEAGVWVIAETTELPTKFARIVVTDERGRYLIPDLPAAIYSVWVRGYGLVDSPKLRAKPGRNLNHAAVPAPDFAPSSAASRPTWMTTRISSGSSSRSS